LNDIRSDSKAQAFLNFLEENGIGDEDFRIGILTQLSRLSRCTGSEKGFYLSVVQGSKPTNQIQFMLLTQLSSIYDESVAAIERLQSARSREEIDSCVNALTKLMRMSVLQYEAYQRLCPSNETNITVQNVSVSDGGRAIVGNITHNAGQSGKGVTKPQLAATNAHATRMLTIGANEQLTSPLPIIEPNERRASARIRRRRRA
jgi:hypothetical protein